MSSDSDRLLFRLQHIIPRSISYAQVRNNIGINGIAPSKYSSSSCESEDVEFMMTFGKVAGNNHLKEIRGIYC